MPAETPRLKISEVFRSLQGEANAVGYPTTFIRLTGCPLRCQYCDTSYAFQGGDWRTVDELVRLAQEQGARHVCVTGGEPLAQKSCLNLLTSLCDAGFEVSLETSGALSIDEVDSRVARVVDFKTPASGEVARNLWENASSLRSHDQVKFVICDRGDYDWSRARVTEFGLTNRCTVLFSPSAEQLPARELADWILEDRLPVRFQIQLHKILWGNQPGR